MKAIIAGLLGALLVLPINFYLQYKILEAVNATELMWFLYFANLPVVILVTILTKLDND